MIVIMVAVPQLNCGTATCTTVYTMSSTVDVLVYAVVITVLVIYIYTGASPGFGRGGGQEFFFSDLGICMSRSDMLRMAKPCALLGVFGGMLPRENFLKRCNLVRFRVYFDQILSLFFLKNAIFYIKNKYFRYTFVMGYFS